jgi:biopolymer transport protein ExbD
MQFEGHRRNSRVPNITPLIDIVFLLLVFFMLTSHFVRDDVMNIQLPKAESGGQLVVAELVEISINAEGQWFYKEQLLDEEALFVALQRDLPKLEDRRVRIRGDRSAALGSAITVIDLARRAGATGVDVVTEHQ